MDEPAIWACLYTPTLQVGTQFQLGSRAHAIVDINGSPCNADQSLSNGDFITLQPHSTIRAGGHHGGGAPLQLPQDADFTQRAEFAANTHGWLAADEMSFICQSLAWSPGADLHFSPPVYWDINKSEFDEGPFGRPIVWDAGQTNIPILAGNHWCGIEVVKTNNVVRVTTVHVPVRLQTRIILILARLIDVGPRRMQIEYDHPDHTPHLCGWQLLFRWATQLGVQHNIAEIDAQAPTSPQHTDQINLVMQASIEDWIRADAPLHLQNFATRLRRHFFVALARRHDRTGPANQRPLATAFPVDFQPQPAHQPQVAYNLQLNHIHERIVTRLHGLNIHPAWACSDEINAALDLPRKILPDTMLCQPAIWDSVADCLIFPNTPPPNIQPYRHVLWPIMENNHWMLAECYKDDRRAQFFLTAPPNSTGRLLPLIQHLRTALGCQSQDFLLHCADQTNPHGLCGQYIVAEIYHRIGIQIPPLSTSQELEIQTSPHAALIATTLQQARDAWARALVPPDLLHFADTMRRHHLLNISRNLFPQQTFAAAAGSNMDTSSPTAKAATASQPSAPSAAAPPDPLWVQDPWMKKSAKPTQSRWEDLTLQAPIPFQGSDGKAMVQTHRLQVSQARAGIVLTTKQHVADLAKNASKLDLALLIPTVDGTKPATLHHGVEGPYEITVEDSFNNSVYKRLALMVTIHGKIAYKLPEPKHKLQTAAVTEVVMEIDSRLHSKAEFQKLKEHPVATFKQLLTAAIPALDTAATIYGVRTTRHPASDKQDQQLQCMLKAPFTFRSQLLEMSGATSLFLRDFIDYAHEPSDTTILPRFWEVTANDLNDMRITTKGIPGAAGLVITRRGLALRIWAKHIAAARQALMPTDPRLTDDNRHVIPRITFQASGWPSGTDPFSLVKSLLEATHVPAVPTRTYRAAGVYTWVMTAETMPAVTRFTVDANGCTHEILLQQIHHMPAPNKGSGKGKPKSTKQPADTSPAPWGPSAHQALSNKRDDERISQLEAKIEQLDHRQSNFEQRVEGKFDHISDSLRQILAASQTRHRETTGETPPSKFSKQA